MKKILHILFFIGTICQAQTGLYNSGNLRIHDQGQLGFHTHLINNGTFDDNLGLAGFYGSSTLSVSGAFMPILYDIEIATDAFVDLETSVNVLNNANFIVGNFNTPRAQPDIYLNFIQNAFSAGEADASKVDGYARITDIQNFTFPVGDASQLRPLILNSDTTNSTAKCAYFLEDPNNPSTFPPFSTDIKPRTISAISTVEFWRLEGTVPSTISISWNARSNLASLATEVEQVTIMGWNKSAGSWLSLGNEALGGDLTTGFVSSTTFVPDDYELITFGILAEAEDILTLDNYILTPNGDGINDVLVIPELDLSPNNSIQIFDRLGLKVFDMVNYQDEFAGISNVDNFVINREKGLPEGIYFYLITMDDLGLNYQGFLYLER
ncbi:gliding motility-associated C-terminal domain-containing protein [Muriicola sp. Z0-33]|uniref:gliding motility-associated C-terminal domain-containing protein n=1 Tax=Muriicola sp. Z0-33 TaxID=2816957 RepID=UPI002238F661|nr:gliding motility-associated C-terminal domain-containing protein [Muriicola sp. Z0-33]MCW5517612.1 gliding motility-associated C-terminal domain-containing protein [Muriicola sp. Z0-33]